MLDATGFSVAVIVTEGNSSYHSGCSCNTCNIHYLATMFVACLIYICHNLFSCLQLSKGVMVESHVFHEPHTDDLTLDYYFWAQKFYQNIQDCLQTFSHPNCTSKQHEPNDPLLQKSHATKFLKNDIVGKFVRKIKCQKAIAQQVPQTYSKINLNI